VFLTFDSLGHLQLPQQWPTSDILAEQCNLARLHDSMLINDQEETYHVDYVSFIKNLPWKYLVYWLFTTIGCTSQS
jgi:hypothetical protein